MLSCFQFIIIFPDVWLLVKAMIYHFSALSSYIHVDTATAMHYSVKLFGQTREWAGVLFTPTILKAISQP